jgi:hypothetical protein
MRWLFFLLAILTLVHACRPHGETMSGASAVPNRAEGTGCEFSYSLNKVPQSDLQELLVGQFHLTLSRGSAYTSGDLVLESARPDRVHMPPLLPLQPLIGWSDIELARLGDMELAVAPSQKNQLAPGVQVLYFERDSSLLILLGGPTTPEAFTFDAGLVMHVQRVARTGFVGRWDAQDTSGQSLHGLFCASKHT